MKRDEHLLQIAEEELIEIAKECLDAAQRISKALRFGVDEVQPSQNDTNGKRIFKEIADLMGVVSMLIAEGVLTFPEKDFEKWSAEKKIKVEKFLKYSKECKTLDE